MSCRIAPFLCNKCAAAVLTRIFFDEAGLDNGVAKSVVTHGAQRYPARARAQRPFLLPASCAYRSSSPVGKWCCKPCAGFAAGNQIRDPCVIKENRGSSRPRLMFSSSNLEALRIALSSIHAHKLRSFLTLIGIIIGVASVVVVGASISGLNLYVIEQVSKVLGVNHFMVARMAGSGNITEEQWEKMERRNRRIGWLEVDWVARLQAADRTAQDLIRQSVSPACAVFRHRQWRRIHSDRKAVACD